MEATVVGPDPLAAPRAVGRRRVDPQPLRLGGSSGRERDAMVGKELRIWGQPAPTRAPHGGGGRNGAR